VCSQHTTYMIGVFTTHNLYDWCVHNTQPIRLVCSQNTTYMIAVFTTHNLYDWCVHNTQPTTEITVSFSFVQ